MFAEGSTHPSLQNPGTAKAYTRTKLTLGIVSSFLSFAVLAFLVVAGYSRELEAAARSFTANAYVALMVFTLSVGILQALVTVPLSFLSGYVIEHRYRLSNQTIFRWAWEHLKGLFVSAPLIAALVIALYFCLKRFGALWWLPLSVVITLFSVVLARLAPILIMPLFYKFVPLGEGSLRERILRLCASAGMRIQGVYSFDMSKNTKKANAGFTGIGRAKRIILGDTLVQSFPEDEIETVFAHELGHYKRRHIAIGIAIGTVSTFLGLWVAAGLYGWSADRLGLNVTDFAALPLLGLWLALFGLVTMPLGNAVSRMHERQADRYAVERTGNPAAFVSALRRLAAMNLADPAPHPLVEFLFYSHPSINRRIRAVEAMRGV